MKCTIIGSALSHSTIDNRLETMLLDCILSPSVLMYMIGTVASIYTLTGCTVSETIGTSRLRQYQSNKGEKNGCDKDSSQASRYANAYFSVDVHFRA